MLAGLVRHAQERFGPRSRLPESAPRPGLTSRRATSGLSAPCAGARLAERYRNLQEFVDGNRMEQRMVGSIARDGLGRVRRELPIGVAGRPRLVTIILPDERIQYRLDSANKIAWRLRMPPPRRDRSENPGKRPLPDGMTTEHSRLRLGRAKLEEDSHNVVIAGTR